MKSWFALKLLQRHYKLLGPMSRTQLEEELSGGRITHMDLVYYPSHHAQKHHWVRIGKVDEFKEFRPPYPKSEELIGFSQEVESQIAPRKKRVSKDGKTIEKTTTKPGLLGGREEVWYLQFQGTEFGPFNLADVGRILDSGKLKGDVFAWKDGLSNWLLIKSIENLLEILPKALEDAKQFIIEHGSNKRIHIRASIVATVSVMVDGKLYSGICADISEGGIQAFNMDAPVEKGGEYVVSVTPIGMSEVSPFTARSMVTWVEAEAKKAGFRFLDTLSDYSIMTYLRNARKTY